MCLASYRLWRFVGLDIVPGKNLRTWLQERHDLARERGQEWKALRYHRALDLITCCWCLGSWISFAVVAVVAQLTSIEMPVLQALAVACIVGLIGGVDG